MAFKCDLTRVATCMFSNSHNTETVFPWLGAAFNEAARDFNNEGPQKVGHHEIAHHGGPRKETIDRWFGEQFAKVITSYKDTKDVDGNGMLGTSLLCFANNFGHGGSHTVNGAPFVLAGSAGGHYKTGRNVAGNRPHNGLLVSLAQAMDVPLETFGDGRFQNAALVSDLKG